MTIELPMAYDFADWEVGSEPIVLADWVRDCIRIAFKEFAAGHWSNNWHFDDGVTFAWDISGWDSMPAWLIFGPDDLIQGFRRQIRQCTDDPSVSRNELGALLANGIKAWKNAIDAVEKDIQGAISETLR